MDLDVWLGLQNYHSLKNSLVQIDKIFEVMFQILHCRGSGKVPFLSRYLKLTDRPISLWVLLKVLRDQKNKSRTEKAKILKI